MTVKTTLSFTERHHRFLADKVGQGVYATTSAAVAAAVERMIEDDAVRAAELAALRALLADRADDAVVTIAEGRAGTEAMIAAKRRAQGL